MIQYEEDGHNEAQKYSNFVLQAKSANNMNFFWLGVTLPKKVIFQNKSDYHYYDESAA